MFDEMFSYSRSYNSTGRMARRPILIHPILLSIITLVSFLESKKIV